MSAVTCTRADLNALHFLRALRPFSFTDYNITLPTIQPSEEDFVRKALSGNRSVNNFLLV